MSSFDENGLIIDRLADIKSQIQADLQASFGDGIDFDDRGPMGILVSIMSERFAKLYELLEAVHDASYPSTSFGIYLDELCAFNGVIRQKATYSTVDLTFTREAGSTGDVDIPSGTQAYAAKSNILWYTVEDVLIADGSDTVVVQAIASEVGPIAAQAGTLVKLVSTPGLVGSVENLENATLGLARESDADLKLRRIDQVAGAGTATESGIKSALNLLEPVRLVQVILNDTDLPVDGQPGHSIAAYLAMASGFNLKQDSVIDFSGDLSASETVDITINGVATSGSPIPFNTDNLQTLDDVAAEIQSHPLVATAVRNGTNQITVNGTGGEAVEIAIVVSGPGTPPTATQTFVGEVLDLIAQTLWDTKAAGIQTYGSVSGVALDTEEYPQTLFFSPLDVVTCHVKYTLSVDSTYQLAETEDAIKAAILDYAYINLTPGVDVLSYKLLSAASDVGASGILTLSCQVSSSGGGPYSDILPIEVSEAGLILAENITFEYI